MKKDYHQQDQDSPPLTREEYYRVVEDAPFEGFTAEECYKVVGDTPVEGFTAEKCYKITEGPERADSFEDLDRVPEGEEILKVDEKEVEKEVYDYFSQTIFDRQNLSPKLKVRFSVGPGKHCEADVVLKSSESKPFVAIAECKGSGGANYGRQQLWGYLCATNTRFGIFANSLNRGNWIFYENLRHFRFRRIERCEFEHEVASDNYFIGEPKGSRTVGATENLSVETADYDQLLEYPEFHSSDQKYKAKVETYFSEIIRETWEYSLEPSCEIQIGSEKDPRIADFVLRGRDGSFIVIVETQYSEDVKGSILETLLSATDTQFGIIAHSMDCDQWIFVEKTGVNQFTHDFDPRAFEPMVYARVRKAACPVFKGKILPEKKWIEYSGMWKILKAKSIWRITEIYHPKCSLKIDEYISDDDYKRAQESYPGCSVKKGNILTKAELNEQHKTWPKLTTEKIWRVTGVFHPGCSFKVRQHISQDDYEQAQVDYPRCSVEKGDILTKTEFTEHRKTWKNLKAEKVWCVTKTDYQRSQSKIKLWQFITAGVGFLVVCFGVLFLMQRNAAEDAMHQNTVLVGQLDEKESEIRRKDSEIQSLTTSVQILKSKNETFSQKISELENQDRKRTFPADKSVGHLRKQLNEQKNENQKLQNQMVKKNVEIRQLQNDKATALSENQRLQSRLAEDKQGITNQNAVVERLRSENLTLQNWNQDLGRQNQELQSKNRALQNQLNSAKQSDSNEAEKLPNPPRDDQQRITPPQMNNLVSESPKKIPDYSEVITRAGSHNNQGCLDFEDNDYDEAAKQFEQAIKADSKFAMAHYNLGCAYLEVKKYTEAVDAFDKAIDLNPRFKEAYYNLGLARFRINSFQLSKQAVEEALSIDPNYQLAQALLTAIESTQQ